MIVLRNGHKWVLPLVAGEFNLKLLLDTLE
jgi:hypothetical protein